MSDQTTPPEPNTPTTRLLVERDMGMQALADEINKVMPERSIQRQHVYNWRQGISLPNYWMCIQLTQKQDAPDWLKDWAAFNVAEWLDRYTPTADQPADSGN